jgi:hypothetical protein
MEEKICNKCNELKTDFPNKGIRCRTCVNNRKKELRLLNSEHYKLKDKEYRSKAILTDEQKINRRKREKIWRSENRERVNELGLINYYKHKEKRLLSSKKWYELNKDKKNNQAAVNNRKKRKECFKFCLKDRLRSRINQAFKSTYWKKGKGTELLIGCDYDTAFNHLEQLFTIGMNWKNRSEWHIDHIIPLASATNEEELIKLCHYTNLQPLWAEDNLKKGAKIM